MPGAVASAVVSLLRLTGWAATIVHATTYAATVFAMAKAQEALDRSLGKSSKGTGLEVAVVDSAADGRVIYGTIRVSGVNVIPPLASGTDGDIIHQVLALAAHEVSSFGSWYLDDDAVTQGEITAVAGNANDGVVTGSSKYASKAWLRGYVGSTTQNVDFILNAAFSSSFTSAFRGRGIAYAAASFKWGNGKTYTGGVPNVSVVVNGKKCYDPRLDVTPGASPTNPAYIAFTSCPALIWADYKMHSLYGQKVDSADIDWDAVVSAANVCDALVAIPTATTQPRYTFNGVLSTAEDTAANERAIVDSMMGKLAFTGGKWRIFAGAWRAPEFTIEREDWVSIDSIQTTAGRNDSRFNGVVVYHVDSARKWQRVEAYRRYSDTYKSADGGERIWIELEQPYCLTEYESQRKGEFMLRQSRNGVRVVGTLPPRYMKLRTWDNVALNFADLGWSGKYFTVATCTVRPDGAVDVVLTEEQDTDWTDLAEGEYNSPSVSAVPATNPTSPSAPSSFSVTTLPGTLRFDFGEPATRPIGTRYQVLQSPGTLAVAGSYSVLWEGDVLRADIWADPRTYYFYHGRCVSNSYYSSGLSPSTYGIQAAPYIPPEAISGNRAYADGEFTYADDRYWTWLSDGGRTSTTSMSRTGGVSEGFGYLRVVVTSNAAPITGEEILPLNFTATSRWTIFGYPVLPKQKGTAYITVRGCGSASCPMYFRGYVFTSSGANSQPPIIGSTWSNSMAIRTQASGTWTTYVMSFTIPDSAANAVGIRAYVPPGYTGASPGITDIGAMQIVMTQ